MIEPTDEMFSAIWRELTSAAQDAMGEREYRIREGLAAVLALVERDQPFAKAGPGEDACGKPHPDRRYTCQRRARHEVCVSWQAGNGSDAWHIDYDGMADEIERLRAQIAATPPL